MSNDDKIGLVGWQNQSKKNPGTNYISIKLTPQEVQELARRYSNTGCYLSVFRNTKKKEGSRAPDYNILDRAASSSTQSGTNQAPQQQSQNSMGL